MIRLIRYLLSNLSWGTETEAVALPEPEPVPIDLYQLIQERNEEKRQLLTETLRRQLKTISDKRVTAVNHDPFPEGAFEQLESKNIWKKVLGYLSEPSDVTSAYFACGTFAKILEERRQLLMLPKALNVFKTKTDEAFNDCDQQTGDELLKNYKAILLKARTVSKGWREAADFHLFEYHPNKMGFLSLLMQMEQGLTTPVKFADVKSVNRMISLLSQNQTSMTSPLIRNVAVKLHFNHRAKARAIPAFLRKLMEFLQIHGSSVWFFNFDCCSRSHFNAGDVYEKLCEILESMPNLRSFTINFSTKECGGGEFRNFQAKVNQHPFPSLALLEHFSCVGKMEESLLAQILRKCRNLRSVSLPYFLDTVVAEGVSQALKQLALENLAGLPIRCILTSNLLQLPWPLKRLEITDAYEASLFFPAINRFRRTLEELSILGSIRIDSSHVPFDLPHLKVFQATSMNSSFLGFKCIGFDHLLPLKSLEKVVVSNLESEDENAIVKVKQYLDTDELDQSNVWQYFPNLKFLRLRSEDGWFYRPTSP